MRRTPTKVLQQLKWLYEQQRPMFDRYAAWVGDMPGGSEGRAAHDWKRRTPARAHYSAGAFTNLVADELEHDDSVVLAILKRYK